MLAVLATAWLLAAPATASASAEATAPETMAAEAPSTPAASAKPAADPMVCRSETPIGSKLPKKVCIRRSDRDRQERESEEALQLIQRRSYGPSTLRDR